MSQLINSHGFEYGVKHFTNSQPGNLLMLISTILEKTPTEVQELLNLGAVYVNNLRQNTDVLINADQTIRVHTKPRRFFCDYEWSSRIVFESTDFIVLNKPSGVPSHPSVDNLLDNSLHQVSLFLKTPLLITHRLDTLTEGLIVYAKTSQFVKSFNHQLQNKMIEKKYVALVDSEETLPAKVIHYMEPSPRAPKKVSPTAVEQWVFCELEILEQKKWASKNNFGSWIKINLLTGRTHQIRAQMSELQAPIKGDQMYGSKNVWKENAIALRACELQFNWNGQLMQFNLDEDFN
jgi:23S rRNA pseudouridine1911/1915/1917 synthase